ncbi:MAG TPA: preprotein translocase subunit SecE [Solirubrobacteraceae bacterium]
MARNRKRAKERRNRRPSGGARPLPGVATARGQRSEETPEAIEHATPDVELAEAQLAVGRQLADEPEERVAGNGELGADELDESAQEKEDLYFEAEREDVEDGDEPVEPRTGELSGPTAAAAERRVRSHSRLINFLQGSWRELQRVQWPDRRAVMQATGVVIGFVIIAGLYLGLADAIASKIVTLLLK